MYARILRSRYACFLAARKSKDRMTGGILLLFFPLFLFFWKRPTSASKSHHLSSRRVKRTRLPNLRGLARLIAIPPQICVTGGIVSLFFSLCLECRASCVYWLRVAARRCKQAGLGGGWEGGPPYLLVHICQRR